MKRTSVHAHINLCNIDSVSDRVWHVQINVIIEHIPQYYSDITDADISDFELIVEIFGSAWLKSIRTSYFTTDFVYMVWKPRFQAIWCIQGL